SAAALTEIYTLSLHDALPIWYFEEVFQRLFEESRKDETPLSVIVLDIDDFKGFNDRYGHLLGDRCLVETGRLIYKIAKETGCFRSEEHTSELQSRENLVCRLL